MPELLELKSLAGGYGAIDVLFDVDLSIAESQVVALCGRRPALERVHGPGTDVLRERITA